VELCDGRTDDTSEASAEWPVGGAPSRSGFLATPTDASPRQAFSVVLSIPGEEMPGSRSKMARRFLAVIESRVCIDPRSRMERKSIPIWSGLGSAARSCRRESPPGSEAVRPGKSPSKRDHANSIKVVNRICLADHVSQRELERT